MNFHIFRSIRVFFGAFLPDEISSARCQPLPFGRVKKCVYERDFESSQGLSLDSPSARRRREPRERNEFALVGDDTQDIASDAR